MLSLSTKNYKIGQNAEDKYFSASCEWIDGRHADILYIPKNSPTEALPPVVVEIQNTVDKTFIRRIIKYCGHVVDKYHVEPIALTICINEVRKSVSDLLLETPKAHYLKKLPSDCWAQEHLFMSKETISDFLNTPLLEMVALGYVLTKQEVSLLSLEYRNDSTVQMLYNISRVALEHEIRDEERTVEVLLNVCENNQDQYKRIIEAIEEDGNDSKRARIYANDGFIYNETCIRKYTKQLSNSSMPEPLALSPTVQTSSSSKSTHKSPLRIIDPNPKKTDMEWVKEFVEEYRTTKKRMSWKTCFDEGRNAGYLGTYSNSQSLKNTFNKLNSKH